MLPKDLMDTIGEYRTTTSENVKDSGGLMLSPNMVQSLEEGSPWRREYRRPTLSAIKESHGSDVSEQSSADQPPIAIPQIILTLPDNETTRELSETDFNANDVKPLEIPDEEDFDMLKATTARLKLSTRRASVQAWKQEHLEKRTIPKPTFQRSDEGFTEEKKERINQALTWLKNELIEMRSQDHVLARQLLSLRHDIQQLKLKRISEEHRVMLDDVTQDVEEVQELHEITDIPLADSYGETPLRQLGVTRMHLTARRFSTC